MGADLQRRDQHGCPPRGLALLLMERRLSWLKVRQGFCPEDFLLGFYTPASMTVTFMLRCHIQGPTQDQLHSCWWTLIPVVKPGPVLPETGTLQSLVFGTFHSALLSFLGLTSASQTTLFHVNGFNNGSFTLGSVANETCYPFREYPAIWLCCHKGALIPMTRWYE